MHAAQIGKSTLDTVPDERQRTHHADDATSCHSPRADIKDVSLADAIGRHLADRYRTRRDNPRRTFAEKFDRGDEHEIGEHAAAAHDRSDARPNDITHA